MLYELTLSEDKDTRIKACDELSQKVAHGELQPKELLEGYKKYFEAATGEQQQQQQQQAMRAFAEVIARADSTAPFADDAVRVLSRFLAGKLDGKKSICDIARGLRVLGERSAAAAFGDGDAEYAGAIAVAVVSGAGEDGGSLATPDAKYDALRVVRLSVGQANFDGKEAVALLAGVRPLFVGERNTRVLREAFGIIAALLAAADPATLATVQQSVFDAFAAYFPVLFVPYDSAVTKEDLVLALRACFAASKVLAPLTVPFLLDKTASSIASARGDAFRTLESCVKAFGPDAFPDDFTTKALQSIQQNGFLVSADAAVNDIVPFVATLYSTFLASRKHCEAAGSFMHEFLSFCYAALYPPSAPTENAPFDEEVSSCARKYIARLARCPECAHLLPAICRRLSEKAAAPEEETPAVYRRIPVGTAADVAASAAVLVVAKAATPRLVSDVVSSVADTLAAALACNAPLPPPADVVCEIAKGVGALAALVEAVPETRRVVEGLVATLAAVATAEDASEAVREYCVESGLRGVGVRLPAAVAVCALDALVKNTQTVALVPALASCNDVLFRAVVDRVAAAVTDPAVFAAQESDSVVCKYRGALFTALRRIFKEASRFPDSAEGLSSSRTTLAAATHFIEALCKSNPNEKLYSSLVYSVRAVTSYAVELLSDADQLALVQGCIAKAVLTPQGGGLSPDCPARYSVFFAALSSLSRPNSTAVFAEAVPVLLSYIAAAATPSASAVLAAADTAQCTRDNINSCCLALAALLNKYTGSDANSPDSLFAKAVAEVISRKDPLPLAWVTRALVMRSHPRGADALGIILTLCAYNESTSDYFYIVTSRECPVDEGLVAQSGAVLRDNYSEKIFNDSLDRLLALHKAAPERRAPAFAVTMVMSSGPHGLVAEKAERCVPVVVRALSFITPESNSATILSMVNALIATVPRNFKDFVPQIVNKMCSLATSATLAKCRSLALTVLLTVRTKVSECVTLLYQNAVISKLRPALDDPRRPVRAAAVECINAWYVF